MSAHGNLGPCDAEASGMAKAKHVFFKEGVGDVALCQHHADAHGLELMAQGFRSLLDALVTEAIRQTVG